MSSAGPDAATPMIREERLLALMRDMVDIYSPTGKEEEITRYLADYLLRHDLPVTLREVADGRRNIEILDPDTPAEVAFIGHVDTVPAFDLERFGFSQDGDRIRGLGSADMKGGCAAMIEAFIAAVEAGRRPPRAALFLVVDEEERGDGTRALLDAHRPDWALIAEPTELRPCLDHYGYLELEIRAFGTRRHASLSGPEYNAIFSLLRALLRVGELLESEYPRIVMNIRDLHSSESGFAVPDRCDAAIDLHTPPAADPALLAERLDELVRTSLTGSAATRHEISFPTSVPGYRLEDQGLLPDLLRAAFGQRGWPWHPDVFRSASDANLLYPAGCRPVILGPGQLAQAHTREESVAWSQVVDAARLYLDLLMALA